MGFIRVKDHIEVYKLRAQMKDIHEMSGRNNKEVTSFCNEEIIRGIKPSIEDEIVDIGCGDGSLLYRISKNIYKGIGIIPTCEEQSRLNIEYKKCENIAFSVGLTVNIPLSNEFATKIICNGVFILLNSKEEVVESLKEIYRISKTGAIIWIGEIPYKDENVFYKKNYGDSIISWLVFLLKNNGVRAFYKGLIKVFSSLLNKEDFIVMPKKHFYMDKEDFIELAERYGFRLIKCFRHKQLDVSLKIVESETRYDYIFQKGI